MPRLENCWQRLNHNFPQNKDNKLFQVNLSNSFKSLILLEFHLNNKLNQSFVCENVFTLCKILNTFDKNAQSVSVYDLVIKWLNVTCKQTKGQYSFHYLFNLYLLKLWFTTSLANIYSFVVNVPLQFSNQFEVIGINIQFY